MNLRRLIKIFGFKKKKTAFTPAKDKAAKQRQMAAIRAYYDKKRNPGRISDKDGKKKIPLGRTFSTRDEFLDKNTKSNKKRTVVLIETNTRDEMAVVSLSGSPGKNKTNLKDYQDGKSYYKHFVEIEDSEGEPIKVNDKFRENNVDLDVSSRDVDLIRDKVLYHSRPSPQNREKIKKFRTK